MNNIEKVLSNPKYTEMKCTIEEQLKETKLEDLEIVQE
jgi:hypothetical protein